MSGSEHGSTLTSSVVAGVREVVSSTAFEHRLAADRPQPPQPAVGMQFQVDKHAAVEKPVQIRRSVSSSRVPPSSSEGRRRSRREPLGQMLVLAQRAEGDRIKAGAAAQFAAAASLFASFEK
jgi:hypothetical protein